jgi:hypothetical protein
MTHLGMGKSKMHWVLERRSNNYKYDSTAWSAVEHTEGDRFTSDWDAFQFYFVHKFEARRPELYNYRLAPRFKTKPKRVYYSRPSKGEFIMKRKKSHDPPISGCGCSTCRGGV